MKTSKLNPLHLDQQLCFSLYATSRLLIQAYDSFLAELGVTYPQYLVLLVLWQNDRLSVKEISKRLLLDSGTLSPLLKKLQQKNLVKKSRPSIDERMVVVELTADGKSLQKLATKIPNAMFCQLAMKEKDVISLRQQLQILTQTLQRS